MIQQSFNFGPSHNVKDPNTSTASSSGLDDLVSKLGSLLIGNNSNQQQLEATLRKAVKDGIIEAKKEDVRVDDSEERGEARRHRELMQHLNRIAALGTHNNHGNNDSKEEKKEDGITIADVLKWGAVAGGVATLLSNLDLLGTSFTGVTDKVVKFKDDIGGYVTETEKFSERMGTLVKDTFSTNGAIGLLLGAFAPGGLLVKTVLGFIGAIGGGQVGKKLQEYGVDTESISTAGVAGGLATMRIGGGGLLAKGAKFIGGFLGGEYAASQVMGRESILERSRTDVDQLFNANSLHNPDGSVNQETAQGVGLAGAAAYFGRRALPLAAGGGKTVVGGAAALLGYDYANDNVDLTSNITLPSIPNILGEEPNDYDTRIRNYDQEIEDLKKSIKDNKLGGKDNPTAEYNALSPTDQHKKSEEIGEKRKELQKKLKEVNEAKQKFIQDQEDASDPYGAKIREYDEELAKLKVEKSNIDVNSSNRSAYKTLSPKEQSKARAKNLEDKNVIIGKIKDVEAAKEKFITDNKSASLATIQEALKNSGVATDTTAGIGNYLGEGARDAAIVGGAFGVLGGPAGIAAGAIVGVAMDSAMEALVTRVERYIIDELKSPPVNLLDLAIQAPNTALQVLTKFAEDHTMEAMGLFGLVAFTVFTPGSSAKVLQGIIKNVPKLGVTTTKTVSGVIKTVNSNVFQGVGRSMTKVGIAAAGGAGTALLLGNNDHDSVLNTPNTRLPIPSIPIPVSNNNTPSAPSIPSALPSNDVVAGNSDFGSTLNSLSNKRANANVDVGNLDAEYARNLSNFIKDAEAAFGDKIEISSAYRPPTEKEKSALRSTATTQEYLYNNRDPNGAPVAKPYSSRHGFGDGGDIYLKKFKNASGMNTMTPEQLKQWKALAAQHQLQIGDAFGENWHVYGNNGSGAKGLKGEEYAKHISQNSLSSAMGGNYSPNTKLDINPYGDLIGQLLRTESKGNPDAFYGDTTGKYNNLLGGKTVSSMSLGELEVFQKKLTKATEGTLKHTDKGTSAAGIGQWVGTTLFGENYGNDGFLSEYFHGKNYDKNRIFDKDLQKDMLHKYMMSDNYGKFGQFMKGDINPEDYADKLGKQWQGLSKPGEKKMLLETLKKIKATPGTDPEKALEEVIGKMESLKSKMPSFNDTVDSVGKSLSEGFDKLGDFLKNVTEQASGLLPQELKDLFDLPAMEEFFSPLFGGESRSTLAHPKKTFTSQEMSETKALLLGQPTTLNIDKQPLLNGELLAQQSSKVEKDKAAAQANGLGNVINMVQGSGNGAETIHGQPIAGLHGNVNTHFPGDIDALSAMIYQYTDAPMFYASGRLPT